MAGNTQYQLDDRPGLYGLMSLWIIAFHLNMFYNPLFGNEYIGRVLSFGECCVDLFLFISGYCIYFSWIRKPHYLSYLKKRCKRILPTFLIISIPYFLWKNGFSTQALYGISGASFLVEGEKDVWFPIAILFFYLISPLIIKALEVLRGWFFVALLAVLVFLLLKVDYFTQTGIMWSRLPAYSLGLYYAMSPGDVVSAFLNKCRKKTHLPPYISIPGLLILLALAVVALPVFYVKLGNLTRIVYIILILPLLFLYKETNHFFPSIIRNILRFCGQLSLEIYLIHLLLLYVVSSMGLDWPFYLIVCLASIPLAYLVRKSVFWFSSAQ